MNRCTKLLNSAHCYGVFVCGTLAAMVAAPATFARAQKVIILEDITPQTPPRSTPDASHASRTTASRAARRHALRETSEIFGYSVRNRPLRAHVLGDGPDVTLIFAAVHGNETATPYLVEQLRLHLRRHPYLLQGRRVVLVPVMNPDGLQARSRRNANNVDINRNYPGTWRRPKRGEGFRGGPRPASEPETRAMMRLTAKYRPDKIVSIHQPLHCLAYSGERSRGLALALQKANGYRLSNSIGYPTPGGFGGYCEFVIKTPVVTLELPWQSPQAAWKRNAGALLAAIQFPPPSR